MNLFYEQLNNVMIGVLSINKASALEATEIKKLIMGQSEKGMNGLILDMSLCQIIDYTFLATLLDLHRKLSTEGYKIKLISLQPNVRMILERARMLSVFEVFASKQDALRKIKKEWIQN